jgi:transcriptional regulator with XRE-family HTH domain
MRIETIGKRIARLRQMNRWTQEALAARLAISRVAVSHIEMDLSIPSERTIALLAGLFKLSPHELVTGTTYPQAKAERLPPVTCQYTPLEQDLALLQNDAAWLERLLILPIDGSECRRLRAELQRKWQARLEFWSEAQLDEREKEILARLRQDFSHL